MYFKQLILLILLLILNTKLQALPNYESVDKTKIGINKGDKFTFDLIKYYNKNSLGTLSYTIWAEDGTNEHIFLQSGEQLVIEILSNEIRDGIPNVNDSYGDYILVKLTNENQEFQGLLPFDIFFSFTDWEFYEASVTKHYTTGDTRSYSGSFMIDSNNVIISSTIKKFNFNGDPILEEYEQKIFDKSFGVLNYKYLKNIKPSNYDELLFELEIKNVDFQQSSNKVDLAFLNDGEFYVAIYAIFYLLGKLRLRKPLANVKK